MSSQQPEKDLAWRPALPDGHTQLSWYKPNPTEVFHPFLQKPASAAAEKGAKETKETGAKDQGKEASKEPAAPQSHARRDHLREIELQVQKEWAAAKIHESHPPAADEKKREPFLVTFPYPYMNGVLHLGHAFTLSKAEFAARYQRLRGKNVLFPFGFHCTGMPIAACADKLKQEIDTYGNPPNFPEEDDEPAPAEAAPSGDAAETKEEPKKKDKAKKGKIAKKKSSKKYQWDIMEEMGVPADEIAKFRDATHWLQYFPPIGQSDLEAFGVMVDFRRSFITTEINPYYDAFIRWHFNTLKAKGKVDFGARLTIFSPSNGQPCADHDRASGEGVVPQEYTLIKLELKKPFPASLAAIEKSGKRVFLPAATLRPETMYGQTNCWVLPDGVYGAYEINDQEVFVCSARSALNMSFQNITPVRGQPKQLCEVKGVELMGHAVKAPLAQYPEVFILPLMTISMDKGTGVVTSVPSDAPDDWAALMDVKNKENLRTKYNIKPEMVMPFDVVPIIEVPGLGTTAAATLCVEKKVKSQNDKALLAEIKEKTYMEGFYKGVMIVGPHKGKKVQDAKPLIRAEMIQRGEALSYAEPESQVIARNGDDCVVALTDQWFLPYGEAEWKAKVAEHVNNKLECYNPATKKKFQETVEWLREWACSRSYGLGTKLPWDPKFVIESLSDSTIYMAYYTIAYELQGGTLDGSKTGPAGIDHKLLSDEVFNYIFLNKQHPTYPANCNIPKEKLDKLRAQFEYWYPVALRVSGKDLIGNHLTMMIYNHTAIWDQEPERWPASFFCNGHVMINAEKMSKSLGNFLTIRDCINEFSADATRLGLADAGDGLMDANFDKSTVNAAILRLTKEEDFIKETWASLHLYRQGAPDTFVDQVFMNDINHAVAEATQCYEKMQYHEALRAGFFDLLNARDRYRLFYEGNSMNSQVLKRFIEVFLIMLSPICPHLTQSLWKLTGHKGFIADAEWPAAQPEDLVLTRKMKYLEDTGKNLRALSDKAKTLAAAAAKKGKPTAAPDSVTIFVAAEYPPWQLAVVQTLIDNQNAEVKLGRSELAREFAKKGAVAKKDQAKAMTFLAQLDEEVQTRGKDALELKLPFDEQSFLKEHLDYVTRGLEIPLERVKVENAATANDNADAETRRAQAVPGQPSPYFYNAAEAAAKAANPAPAPAPAAAKKEAPAAAKKEAPAPKKK